ASALRSHVGCAASRNNVINMHSAEIDAKSSAAGGVGHARVHLRTGKKQQASWGRNDTDLRIELHRFLGTRLLAGVLFQKLCGVVAACAVPLVIGVRGGPVA